MSHTDHGTWPRLRWPSLVEGFWLVVTVTALRLIGPGYGWPLAVLVIVNWFRPEIGAAMRRRIRGKVKDVEFEVEPEQIDQAHAAARMWDEQVGLGTEERVDS